MIGMKTKDTIFEAMKEGEIKMLDNIWKRVKNNQSLTKLREEVGFQEVMVQVAKAAGEEPPEFKDHTLYSNKEMENLLELNELAITIRTEIIPPQYNKTIKARTPLVLMGTCMNVITKPLHWDGKALP